MLLAWSLGCDWRQLDGTQVFVPRPRSSRRTAETTAIMHRLAEALARSHPETLRNGISFAHLSESEMRDIFTIMNRVDPGLAPIVAAGMAGTNVRFRMRPLVKYWDPQTNQELIRALPDNEIYGHEQARELVTKGVEAPTGRPLATPRAGPLDLSEGLVLTLRVLVEKAEAAFGVPYLLDSRLSKDYVFVRGRFDRADFRAALNAYTAVSPVREHEEGKESPETVDALLKDVLRSLLDIDGTTHKVSDNVSADDWLNRRSLSVAQLAKDKPELLEALRGWGWGQTAISNWFQA